MSTKSFEAQVNDWVRKSERRLEAVFKSSAQDVFAAAQLPVARGGNMPVDTGTLRASLIMALNGGVALGGAGATSYVLAIAGAKIGDVVQGTWTANYARPVEYGSRGRQGRRFVGQAADRWQQIVTANVARAQRIK